MFNTNKFITDFKEKTELFNAFHYDMISIRMLEMCVKSVHKSLEYIFRASLNDERFPLKWKKANVVSIHKKDDKQILKNYRLVLLLPICATRQKP